MSHPLPMTADEPSLLPQVDEALRASGQRQRFSRALEAQFLTDTHQDRLRNMQLVSMLAGFFMCLFLVPDYTLTPDVFDSALRLRIGFLIAGILFTAVTFRHRGNAYTQEWMAVALSLVAVLMNMGLVISSDGPLRQLHLLGNGMIILYHNVILRPRFQLALPSTTLMMLGLGWTGWSLPPEARDLHVLLPVMLAVFSTAIFSLYFLYTLDREERHNYLMSRRHRLMQTRLAHVNQQLDQLARLDPLTLVPNRRHLDEHLAQLWQRARHQGDVLAVLMIDIDHFKAYNDRHGHPAGDACLRAVAQALAQSLRHTGDVLARYGGEEFIVVMQGVDPAAARQTAERLCKAVRTLQRPHEDSPLGRVTVSVGLCAARVSPDTGLSATDWVAAADQALYEAKRQGRDRVHQADLLDRATP